MEFQYGITEYKVFSFWILAPATMIKVLPILAFQKSGSRKVELSVILASFNFASISVLSFALHFLSRNNMDSVFIALVPLLCIALVDFLTVRKWTRKFAGYESVAKSMSQTIALQLSFILGVFVCIGSIGAQV